MPETDASDPAEGAAPTGDPGIREWLVDGFNVLHAVVLGGRDRSGWWAAQGRERLLSALAEEGLERERVWVVFDGGQPDDAADPAGLRTVFAPSADEWLVRRVKDDSEPRRLAVVTADRRLAARGRHAGARVVSPRDFLHLSAP